MVDANSYGQRKLNHFNGLEYLQKLDSFNQEAAKIKALLEKDAHGLVAEVKAAQERYETALKTLKDFAKSLDSPVTVVREMNIFHLRYSHWCMV